MLLSCTVHPSASAMRTAIRTASASSTGNDPGNPRQTGHTLVLGGAPNEVEQPQNTLVRVRSCAWTSRPMTASNSDIVREAYHAWARAPSAERREPGPAQCSRPVEKSPRPDAGHPGL